MESPLCCHSSAAGSACGGSGTASSTFPHHFGIQLAQQFNEFQITFKSFVDSEKLFDCTVAQKAIVALATSSCGSAASVDAAASCSCKLEQNVANLFSRSQKHHVFNPAM